MKTLFAFAVLSAIPAVAEPLLDSWLTDLSGRYARIYPDNSAVSSGAPVTVWSRGAGTQSQPTYSGVNEISYDGNKVYIRTTSLGFHTMGPWYEGGNLVPDFPANIAEAYSFPRTPNIPVSKIQTGGDVAGYFVDGVSMFDSSDSLSYSASAGEDADSSNAIVGDGIWLRDAYVTGAGTFDNANGHPAGPNYHYHTNPPALRNLLGDSVDYVLISNTYTEAPNGQHSPIIGWVRDGLPVYGPYGFSDPTDPTSIVRCMISGYQLRDGSNGSADLLDDTAGIDNWGRSTGRTTLPQWMVRNDPGHSTATLDNTLYGPSANLVIGDESYALGRYLQDWDYKGDLAGYNLYEGVAIDGAYNSATHYDLNEYNVRFTVTPEFPDGTWAYFTNIAPDGTPCFPYNIARYFFGQPSGDATDDIPPTATKYWEGGPEKGLDVASISVDAGSGDVTLIWNSVEGGHYSIDRSSSLDPSAWVPLTQLEGTDATTLTTDNSRGSSANEQFYQVTLDSIEPFDDIGFDYDSSIISNEPPNNVLLLILDDWGLDASELYNTESGVQLASMPNLKSLLFSNPNATPTDIPDKGLLFTRGYSQPICSPTRATILTGRQPYQHTVGNPQADATLPSSELTFPEIMTSEATAYGLASFGKWHLGSGNTGPLETGGWPNFSGSISGAIQAYDSWPRIEIENGILTDSGTTVNTYATTAQVDEACAFIKAQDDKPWVVWMGFNAPHDPFHDPAPFVTPTGGYSTSGTTDLDYYIRMLEALDHEIGNLLLEVDLNRTNIIVVGDNGTPIQVDQVPAGGLASAKGSLNEGGIHVPFFATGPDIALTGTSDKLVHVVDLFATILDLTGVNTTAATNGIDLHSKSLVPIFNGFDMEDRCIISEKFGLNVNTDGRSLIMDDWPQYKLVSIQDVTDPSDTPSYQMYLIGTNGMEASTLTTPPIPGDAWEEAYNALVSKDQSLIPAATSTQSVYLELAATSGPASPPQVQTTQPNSVTYLGIEVTSIEGRLNQAETYDRYWVKVALPTSVTIDTNNPQDFVVTFPINPFTGDTRVFNAISATIAP